MRQIRVHELLDAPLAHVRERRQRDPEVVERDRERLAVELSRADHFAGVGEHERVVGHRVDLARDHALNVLQRSLERAVDLRHAAQRVRILHAIALDVALEHLRSRQARAHVGRRAAMAGVALQVRQALVERLRAAQQRLDRERGDRIGALR